MMSTSKSNGTDDMESHNIPGGGAVGGGAAFGYSATNINGIGSSQITLVVIAVDTSPSVDAFRAEIEKCLQAVVAACRVAPYADALLLRVITFDGGVRELHGFDKLENCIPARYQGAARNAGGATALFDAAFSAIGSADDFGRKLIGADYTAVNAVVFVITDGEDNVSKVDGPTVGERAQTARGVGVMGRAAEMRLESLISILIGVNIQDARVQSALSQFKTSGAFDQYVEMAKADRRTLAKLADFMTSSVATQSQATGTGAASQVVDPAGFQI